MVIQSNLGRRHWEWIVCLYVHSWSPFNQFTQSSLPVVTRRPLWICPAFFCKLTSSAHCRSLGGMLDPEFVPSPAISCTLACLFSPLPSLPSGISFQSFPFLIRIVKCIGLEWWRVRAQHGGLWTFAAVFIFSIGGINFVVYQRSQF
jgi:hypothetical protein